MPEPKPQLKVRPKPLGRFQFSLRVMFWMVTLIAVLTAIDVYIWQKSMREVEAIKVRNAENVRVVKRRVAEDLRDIEEEGVARIRASIEAVRGNLLPGTYEKMQADVDAREQDAKARFNAAILKIEAK